jgi:hypothetical protein
VIRELHAGKLQPRLATALAPLSGLQLRAHETGGQIIEAREVEGPTERMREILKKSGYMFCVTREIVRKSAQE